MKKLLLMRSQRNDVLKAVEQHGLIPSDFRWGELKEGRVPMVADPAYISAIVHLPTQYRFVFDMRSDPYWATFTPGRESPEQHEGCKSWGTMLGLVNEWASNLKREVDAPDLWANLVQETGLAEAAAAQTEESSFAPEQHEQIRRGLGEIRRFLIEGRNLSREQDELVTQRLDYLGSCVERMSRRDWMHTAIGVLFTIAVGLGLAGNEARDLFSAAANALREALDVVTKLLP